MGQNGRPSMPSEGSVEISPCQCRSAERIQAQAPRDDCTAHAAAAQPIALAFDGVRTFSIASSSMGAAVGPHARSQHQMWRLGRPVHHVDSA